MNFPPASGNKADKSISTVTFASDDITILIQNLDPNKAHGHDSVNVNETTRQVNL